MTALLAIALGYVIGRMHKPRRPNRHVRNAMRYWHAKRMAYDAGP